MTQHVQLNNVDHAKVKIRTERSSALGDDRMFAPVFPHEFRHAQAHYPIVFMKDASIGGFRPVSLFGLEEGQNLFLSEEGWDAAYLPLAVRMQPFVIGFIPDGEGGKRLEVHLDKDHPRVNEAEGEPLFLDHGGHAPFLQDVTAVLEEVHHGEKSVAGFCRLLDELQLIEPFALDVTLNDGTQGRLAGYYTIHEERLYNLNKDELGRLQESGALLPVFMVVASLTQFQALVQRRNDQLASE